MGHEYKNLDELRPRIVELANVFLPDGLNPFVDVFERVRARREMRRLIDEATVEWSRQTPGQFIEMLFHGNGRLQRKISEVYGKRAGVPVEIPTLSPPQSYAGQMDPTGTIQ